jgi:hypothetical protein
MHLNKFFVYQTRNEKLDFFMGYITAKNGKPDNEQDKTKAWKLGKALAESEDDET